MKAYLFIFVFFFVGQLAVNAQDCDCKKDFNLIRAKIEANYSGFQDKVTPKNRATYLKMTKDIEKKASKTEDFAKCTKLLRLWLAYFKDNHVYLGVDEPSERHIVPPPTFEIINQNTCLLKIPSFEYDYKSILDSIVLASKDKIKDRKNLIIDLSGNGGGSDDTYDCLLPYIYTGPVALEPVELWCSPDNIKEFEELAADTSKPVEFRKEVEEIVAKMKQGAGTYVNISGKDTLTKMADTIYPYPSKIGILTDENNASSAEQFLLEVKQSKRVFTFGTGNTSGTLDYSNLSTVYLPSGKRAVNVPTSRSMRLPLHPFDASGFRPDVIMKKNTKDKIKFIEDYLNR